MVGKGGAVESSSSVMWLMFVASAGIGIPGFTSAEKDSPVSSTYKMIWYLL